MADDKSLTDHLRESIEARRKTTPEQYKLDMLAKELPELKQALRGVNWLLNLAVANSRDVVKSNEVLREEIIALNRAVEELKAALGEQQMTIEKNSERLDGFAQWAKTKGKQ